MFLDRVLNGAAAINPTAGSLSIADSVSTANLADVYKFTLQQNSSLNLLASRLSGDVNLAIVQDKNGNGVVNPGEVLHQSANVGLLAEQLKVKYAAAGKLFYCRGIGRESGGKLHDRAGGHKIDGGGYSVARL